MSTSGKLHVVEGEIWVPAQHLAQDNENHRSNNVSECST